MWLRRPAATAIVLVCSVSLALACSKERGAVKNGADRDAGDVDLTPKITTIAELSDLKAPPSPNTRKASRFRDAEFQTFTIDAILVGIKKESDEDYHIVIQAPGDEEGLMVIESVSPNCTDGSIFTQQIEDVRTAIDEKIPRIGKKIDLSPRKRLNIPVTVTGVGFFDPIHGQDGVAPNGIELHPILDIKFN
jgi:hypothetical protein